MRLLREVGVFLPLLVQRLSAYITGGVVVAAVVVYEHMRGQNVAAWPFVWGTGAFLVIAFYSTWRDEHRRADTLLREYEELRSELQRLRQAARHREALGRLLVRGQDLTAPFTRGHSATHSLALDLLDDVDEWVDEVEVYLHEPFGMSGIARFRQDAMLPSGTVAAGEIAAWRTAYEQAMLQRCRNLTALMAELRE